MIIAGVCATANAQNSDWQKLQRVSVNTTLIVERKTGERIGGYLVSVGNREMKLKSKKGEIRFERDSIKRVYEGIEKRKVPLWGRIVVGVVTFSAIAAGSFAILRPDELSDDINYRDLIGMVAATAGTAITIKQLRKLKTLKKGDLLYQE